MWRVQRARISVRAHPRRIIREGREDGAAALLLAMMLRVGAAAAVAATSTNCCCGVASRSVGKVPRLASDREQPVLDPAAAPVGAEHPRRGALRAVPLP